MQTTPPIINADTIPVGPESPTETRTMDDKNQCHQGHSETGLLRIAIALAATVVNKNDMIITIASQPKHESN